MKKYVLLYPGTFPYATLDQLSSTVHSPSQRKFSTRNHHDTLFIKRFISLPGFPMLLNHFQDKI